MVNSTEQKIIWDSLEKLQTWVEDHDYKGYEPFDGLTSYVRPLAFGNRFLEQLLQHVGRHSPINLRPLMGIKPLDSTKGRGYMAYGYWLLFKSTGRQEYRLKAESCLEWLDLHKSPKYAKHSWGNSFDYVSRGGWIKKHESTIVWTSLVGQAFLEAYEITSDPRWLKIADCACGWIMDLPREKTASGNCLSYVAFGQSTIHNSNMLGAGMLARTAKHTGNKAYLEVARSAMQYSCTRQLPDGAWYYGENPTFHWIDNHHTGYNLDALKFYIDASGDPTYRPQLQLGLDYFKSRFFEPDGCPKYYHNRAQPSDIQAASQSIETLAYFSDQDPDCLALGLKAAHWTITHMQDKSGYFYYRKYPLMTAKIPMIHWGQATMFKGLSLLNLKLSSKR